MPDLEPEEIHHLLSLSPATIPGQVSRRRFLQGAAAAGTIASSPVWFDHLAQAATPVGASEGILIVLHLGGGNDGLNTVVPIGDSTYRSLRGNLAITNPVGLTSTVGLHPNLPKLKDRYAAGKVAIIQGVGQSTVTDLSHFSSTASWMAGTAGTSRTSGWLGRWLDGVPQADEGMRAITVGSSIPLHLVGQRSVVTALNHSGDLFGADRDEAWEVSVYDTVAAYGSGPTGKGAWADRIATAGAASVGLATDLSKAFTPALPNDSLTSQLTLVARLINANLGIRIFNVSPPDSFDTHEGQSWRHAAIWTDVDAAIEAFYATLSPTWTKRVAMMSFSEFGRRPQANASGGTDHGTASALFVIGENVKGGLYGAAPDLTKLDSRGNLPVAVDYRSAYASVLGGWLGGDTSAVLGGAYEDLGLFKAKPGGGVTTPPPPTGPWLPFATPSDLIRQQYLDFYGRVGDSGGVTYWTNQLTSGRRTIPSAIESFLRSTEFGRAIAPVARLALVALGTTPAFDDLMAWAARIRDGEPLAAVAPAICAAPAFTIRYGSLTPAALVKLAATDVLGAPLPAAEANALAAKVQAGTLSRPALLADLVSRPAAGPRFAARVDVLMTYAGLLRRRPDPSGWTHWVAKVSAGTSIQRLIAQFFASSEYRRRFTG